LHNLFFSKDISDEISIFLESLFTSAAFIYFEPTFSKTMVKAKKVKVRNKSEEVSAASSATPADMELDEDTASSPPKSKRKKIEEKPSVQFNDQSMNE